MARYLLGFLTLVVIVVSGCSQTDSEPRITPGSELEIGVFELVVVGQEYVEQITVPADGKVNLPGIDPVVATGSTPAELKSAIIEAITHVRDPAVRVELRGGP